MPVKGDQHVQTERHDLESQEDDDQVVRLGHEDRTRRGSESEDLVLGAAHAFAHRPVVGDRLAIRRLTATTPVATTLKPSSTIASRSSSSRRTCPDRATGRR